jgi:copper(I)-binding protein
MRAAVALWPGEPTMKYNVFAFVLVAMLGVAGAALAGDFTVGDITVGDPWSRATVGAASNGVIYLTIANRSGKCVRCRRSRSAPARPRS